MQFCNLHWTLLRSAIHERGLFHLVAASGEECARRMQLAQQEQATGAVPSLDGFDPLMMSHQMIVTKAVELGGPNVLIGDLCPVCEAMRNLANTPCAYGRVHTADQIERDWIEGPTNAVLGYARDNGFIGRTQ